MITITGEPKEIAALVLAIQGQQITIKVKEKPEAIIHKIIRSEIGANSDMPQDKP